MKFETGYTCGDARTGVVTTDHGLFATPAFMPVGTQGTVKAMPPAAIEETGSQIILSNAYHLYLRPGTETLFKAGGLHKFMDWGHPILTDSGGFQVFSLAPLRKISDNGVEFRSHIDGSLHVFTPESVVDIQRAIGSDIMMPLDECTAYPVDAAAAAASNAITLRWAARSRARFENSSALYGHSQALFGIVQGSTFPEIRRRCAGELIGMGFDGYAIGGLAVGEPAGEMYDIVSLCTGILPGEKPRYLMGVGTPADLLESIGRGVDMFDCVLPTRNARNGMLFTGRGPLNITNARFKEDMAPVDESCGCSTCRRTTRSYLRHLFLAKEILGLQLATHHNLSFYQSLMTGAGHAIRRGGYEPWKQDVLAQLSGDPVLTQSTHH